MTQPQEIWFICSHCGAANAPTAVECSLCGRVLDVTSPTLDEPDEPPKTRSNSSRTFSIASILWLIALIAVCLGVAKADLVSGIVLAVITVPAFVRTMIVVNYRKTRGLPLDAYEKVVIFFLSFVVMIVIPFAVVIAFFMSCFTVGSVTNNLTLGLFAGAASVVALIFLILNLRRAARSGPPKGNRR